MSTDLNTGTSGDIVASRELEAMRQLAKENNEQVIIFDYKDIHPIPNNLPDIPLLIDYMCMTKLSKMDLSEIDLAHMYGGCYSLTIPFLKSKGIKTTLTNQFHSRSISIQEHEQLFGKNSFPFNHITDDKLWNMYIYGIKEADIVITGGAAGKNLILKEGAKRVEIISHGCYIPDENKIKQFPKQFRTGYIGAYGPDKGIRYLLEAWSILNYQDDSVLVFAGSQSQNLEQFIQKYATGGKYHLMGYANDVADFYNNISIYVQPSATEGFGLETLEAMSYKRPVIASDGAGSASCITDNENGFVVPKMNSQAIAEKIHYFKTHPNKIIEFGNKAREKSYQYSWDKVKYRYINTWKNLLSRNKL